MSRNRRWKLREIQPDCTGDGAEFVEFVRSHDPEMMGPLTVALSQRRTLFSWLTPGKRVLGLPDWVDQNLQWLTLVDDLGVAATGPNSFDHLSLKWWITRAYVLVVDAAPPTARLYEAPGSLAADGYLMLIVQTTKDRRLLWQNYFISVRPPDAPTYVVHHLVSRRPGGPKQLVRTGGLWSDFVSDRPIDMPRAAAPATSRCITTGVGSWESSEPTCSRSP